MSSRQVRGDFSYPFNALTIYSHVNSKPLCSNETLGNPEKFDVELGYRSEAEFFVFTGVVSMLFVLVAAAYYVFFEDRAKDATSTDVGLLSFPVVVRHLLMFL